MVSAASAAGWLVLPAHGEHPPPSDPTLLRLSQQVAQDFAELVSVPVRLVDRKIRADVCRQNGHECPVDTASMLDAENVLELGLSDDATELNLNFYGPHERVLTAKLPCEMNAGRLRCDTKGLGKKLEQLATQAFSEASLRLDLDKIRPRLKRCFKRRKMLTDVKFEFMAHPSGHISKVSVTPMSVAKSKAGRCAARILESYRTLKFRGSPTRMIIGLVDSARTMRRGEPE